MLGLAVPVTASYIISAVMIAPALIQVGIAPAAAHMFIFYYAVLSDVSPPTALAPYAAAAVTGGDAMRTTLLTWKYTLPAFLVPFAFTLAPEGMGLLLRAPLADVLRASLSAALGVAALAVALGGWLRRAATPAERAAGRRRRDCCSSIPARPATPPASCSSGRRRAPSRARALGAERNACSQRRTPKQSPRLFDSVTARPTGPYNPRMCVDHMSRRRRPRIMLPGGSVGEP